ncbi:hypothetical protein CK203_076828 [Vitis vinifera]|uniref:Uncharacterized protein n=1 Tax=Vitis vinifera TaxID=29760 RepID=A0A438ESR9_VITVI|nr:hypothetical protein CK203_076828 [Vitis vinifera]
MHIVRNLAECAQHCQHTLHNLGAWCATMAKCGGTLMWVTQQVFDYWCFDRGGILTWGNPRVLAMIWHGHIPVEMRWDGGYVVRTRWDVGYLVHELHMRKAMCMITRHCSTHLYSSADMEFVQQRCMDHLAPFEARPKCVGHLTTFEEELQAWRNCQDGWQSMGWVSKMWAVIWLLIRIIIALTYQMCHQNSCVHFSAEEAVAAEESLLIYCKPVELYNILQCRALQNPEAYQPDLPHFMKFPELPVLNPNPLDTIHMRQVILVNSFVSPKMFALQNTSKAQAKGDPLSSYLFVLIMVALSCLIAKVEQGGFIRGLRVQEVEKLKELFSRRFQCFVGVKWGSGFRTGRAFLGFLAI